MKNDPDSIKRKTEVRRTRGKDKAISLSASVKHVLLQVDFNSVDKFDPKRKRLEGINDQKSLMRESEEPSTN